MTPLQIAALVFGIPNGLLFIHSLVRWFRPYRDTPCPGERDAHDALRDGGEGGEFRTIHNEGINS